MLRRSGGVELTVAVGTRIAFRPPRRSGHAAFPHPAPVSGRTRSAFGVLGTHAAPIRGLAASVTCLFRRCDRGMRCNSPFPRPAAFPPPSPLPMSLGIVRGFTHTMQSSDFSSTCMPIVRRLPSWAGPECWPDTDEISQVPTKGRHHVHLGLRLREAPQSASHLRGKDVAFRPTARRQHLGIRPVSQLNTQPVVYPMNASS
jgi:hypothetical protein